MNPQDLVLQELQHRDQQRSRLLRAIENKAASACKPMVSVENHFQSLHEQAQRASKFKYRSEKSKNYS